MEAARDDGLAHCNAMLRDALGEYDIPFDSALIKPPAQLRPRFRQYAMAMPQLGGDEWTYGYEEIAHCGAVFVLVLFTDVAVDYFIRSSVLPAMENAVRSHYGADSLFNDRYMVARKELAVLARLGSIGRNGLFFSRKFGFNCKIEALFFFVPVEGAKSVDTVPRHWRLGVCHRCNECVKACPVSAYDNFQVHDPLACERHITPDWYHPERMCRNCIVSCPASALMLERRHQKMDSPYAIYEPLRREQDTYRVSACISSVSDEDGLCIDVDGMPMALPDAFQPVITWLLRQDGDFTVPAFCQGVPELAPGLARRCLDVLERVGVVQRPHAGAPRIAVASL